MPSENEDSKEGSPLADGRSGVDADAGGAGLGEANSEQPFRLYSAASVGPAIRHFRGRAGLTQAQLAELAGLNRSYLSELEQGKETEQLRRVLRVFKLLGVRATLQQADW
jgi:HTH-type transcriptional regulator / antitoxin HipB